MRWLIVFLLAFVLFNGLTTWLRRIGLGRLPGDFTLRWRGRAPRSCASLSTATRLQRPCRISRSAC
jgi:hypothetical protein